MRSALAIAVAITVSTAGAAVWAQTAQAPSAAPAPAAAPTPAAAPAPALPKCDNPNALGVERIVQIDTTGGPGFGFEHFKAYDFLRDKEVVLTFDDGPWPVNTPAVLKALADNCTKAVFFPIGKHAGWHPEIMKQVAAAGHTVGSHTWSHKDLSKLSFDEAKAEFEKGVAAVSIALGNKPVGPFFRFPALRHPPEMLKYVGERNLGVFSTDMDSFDFKMRKPEQVVASVMKKLEKHGKGIILMHDFQKLTGEALPVILARLKAGGYKVVHMKTKTPFDTLPEYDAMMVKDSRLPQVSSRPVSSVWKPPAV